MNNEREAMSVLSKMGKVRFHYTNWGAHMELDEVCLLGEDCRILHTFAFRWDARGSVEPVSVKIEGNLCRKSNGEFYLEFDKQLDGYDKNGKSVRSVLSGRLIVDRKTVIERNTSGVHERTLLIPKAIENIEMTNWKPGYPVSNYGAYQTQKRTPDEAWEKVKELYPYTYKWCQSIERTVLSNNRWGGELRTSIQPDSLLDAPFLELLYKADFKLAGPFLTGNVQQTDWEKLFRLCNKDGTDFKSLFKVDKGFWSAIKSESDISAIDSLRIMYSKKKITPQELVAIVDYGYSSKDLREMNSILNFEYNGKKVFSFESLANFLERVDHFQAMDKYESIPMLRDCLKMWQDLHMEPDIDSDSLSREHAILCRSMRNVKDEKLAREMQENCDKASKYNYDDGEYIIRSIKSYDDLSDEANQQHNCVKSYASYIAKGTSMIFVMRKKSDPEKSFVTIELSSRFEVRQKLKAYNHSINDSSVTDRILFWAQSLRERYGK